MSNKARLHDLIGIEHHKLNFFQELQQNIAELKDINRESEDQRCEIAAILDGITDVMMVLSENMEIISVNHVFERLFPGINPIGKKCYSLFRDIDHPCPECPAFKSLSTNSVCKNTAIFRIEGKNMQFDMVASPLKNPEVPDHRILIFKRDVTMEKEYQAKFYQAEKMATIGVLAAGVAHEINNPMAAVAGFAEGIQRRLTRLEESIPEDLAEDLYDYTNTILKECLRCQDIVKTLLSFSRPVASEFIPVNLNQVAEDTLRLLDHQFRRYQSIRLNMNLASPLGHIYGNEAQLKQVVLNLLTNAVDAVEEDGEISVETFVENNHIGLRVSDSGCGIAPEIKDMLFEPFFTTKNVGKGIGIGLSTCFNIVREHNGEIIVDSEVGKGSTFTVLFPVQ
ncbi:two-component system sensor histidine kinase NtrB [Maridesulfovibrio hydrothermalis]|uniref:histidine kinase n=1 Tax=Maridesulfovibrio hydrothermalis AM13 = DSM 14728 TaxID=1121451 RepID=L0R933_9BACT|nr:ATP-binding protein [Maridesulfovibrio hydrothermalis]CCO22732.1 PAS/PAC sensor signal transduction histidine kinase [Maridesulfovibrio hydrothermalis AM13 = DSM 14728]